jgi:multiple sugar transport system substrate-binding protein
MLMNIKKMLLLIMTVAWLVMIFGCGEDEDTGKIIVRYFTPEALPKQREGLEALIDDFESKNPAIKVKVEWGLSQQKLMVQMSAGTAPDVVYWSPAKLSELADRGMALDLTQLIEEDTSINLDDYFDVAIDRCVWDGKMYAMPLHIAPLVLYYNKDHFDEAGISYPDDSWGEKEFLDAAGKLTRDFDGDGKTDRYGATPPGITYWLNMNHVEVFNAEQTECLLDRLDAVAAFERLIKWKEDHDLLWVNQAQDRQQPVHEMFKSGKLSMMLNKTFLFAEYKNSKYLAWDIAPVPWMDKDKPRSTHGSVGIAMISSNTKQPDAAWKWVKFLSGEPGQTILYGRPQNGAPALERIARSDIYMVSPPENIQVAVDVIETARFLPVNPHYTEIYQVISGGWESVVAGETGLPQAIVKMKKRIDEILTGSEY